jgi:hypothetical protein
MALHQCNDINVSRKYIINVLAIHHTILALSISMCWQFQGRLEPIVSAYKAVPSLIHIEFPTSPKILIPTTLVLSLIS